MKRRTAGTKGKGKATAKVAQPSTRALGIVPRFLKNAVTIGAIPALAAACEKSPNSRHAQPVVAYYAQPVVAYYAADAMPSPPPTVVAAYQQPPVVAAYQTPPPPPPIPQDAAVDAPHAKQTKQTKPKQTVVAPPPPPPVVAAYQTPDFGPAVVAAYVPHDPTQIGAVNPPAKKPPAKKPPAKKP